MQAMAKTGGEPEKPIWSAADMGLVSAANGSRQSNDDDDDADDAFFGPADTGVQWCGHGWSVAAIKDVDKAGLAAVQTLFFALLLRIASLLLAGGEIPLFP